MMCSILSVAGRGVALTLACALISGCGGASDSLPREAVSGKVAIEGTPVAKGSILFRSADGAMEVGGLVKDGTFEIPKADGPVPGKYKVSITEALERPAEKEGEQFTLQPKTKPSKQVASGTLDAEVKAGSSDALVFDFQRTDANARSKGKGSR